MKKVKRFVFGFLICLLLGLCVSQVSPAINLGNAIEVQAATVKLNKKSVTINRYQTTTLRITGTKSKVTWSSSNKKVATVTSKGVVKGVKKGRATITAKVNKKTYKCTVTVEEPELVIPNSIEMKSDGRNGYAIKGTKATLKVTGTKNKVTWSADDYYSNTKKKVSITSKGVVTFKKLGTCRITAEVNGKIIGTLFIYIEDPIFDYSPDFITVGSSCEFKMENIKRTPKWSIQDSSIAFVTSNGKKCTVTGRKAGTTYLTATIGNKTYKQKLNVKAIFEVSSTNVTCSDETRVNVYLRESGKLSFSVQDTSIISCRWNPFDGEKSQLVITPLRRGSTTITVTNSVNNEKIVIYVTVPNTGGSDSNTSLSFRANLYADRTPTLVILLQFTNTSNKPITINGQGVLSTGSIDTNMITFDNGFVENTVVQPGKSVNLGLVKTNLGYFNVSTSSIYGFYLTYDNTKYIAIISYDGRLLRLTKSGYSANALLGEEAVNEEYISENLVSVENQLNKLHVSSKLNEESTEVQYKN